MKRPDDLLGEVSAAVSDGGAVNWEAYEKRMRSEAERRCLRNLRLVSEVARLARVEEPAPAAHSADDGAVQLDETVAAERRPTPSGGRAGDTLPCETWGHLKLLERIGAGGFADVYRAWDQSLYRQVALKLLRADLSVDPEWEARFLAEGRLLARTEHPHVVRIYGIDSHAGRIGIWMELVAGTSLADLVAERGPMEARDAARIGIDLCGALAAIHAADVIHQDIKPHNVLRDTSGRIVLMDFGAGRSRRANAAPDAAGLVGTPRYMAPELFAGVAPSPQSDVYSLGLLLTFLVTARHPAESGTGGRAAPVHLAATRPDLPESFRAVIDRALSRDRTQRFPTAFEMQAALESALGSLQVTEIGASGAPHSGPRTDGRHTAPRGSRRPALALAAAVLLALVGAVLMARRGVAPAALAAQVEFTATRTGASRLLAASDAVTAADRLELRIELSRPAHVYVLNLDAAGRAVLLFPMAGGGARNPLPALQPVVLPGQVQGERLGWTLSADEGVESFLVVASTERLADFEAVAAKIPAVAIGGGLTATPVADVAMTALVRGVTGVAKIPAPERTSAAADLLELVRSLAQASRASRDLWLHELRLQNRGR